MVGGAGCSWQRSMLHWLHRFLPVRWEGADGLAHARFRRTSSRPLSPDELDMIFESYVRWALPPQCDRFVPPNVTVIDHQAGPAIGCAVVPLSSRDDRDGAAMALSQGHRSTVNLVTPDVLDVSLADMRVDFYRDDEARVSRWEAVRGRRTRIPGTVMGLGRGVISHDLAQFVIEAATGYQRGFWGLLAQGATFKSTGRRRTRPGRAMIAAHRQDLLASEHLAGAYLSAWKAGAASPVTHALDRAAGQFSRLRPGERLRFDWPSTVGQVVRVDSPDGRRSRGGAPLLT